jgi:CrcB protein
MAVRPEHDAEAATDGNHVLPIDPDIRIESADETQTRSAARGRHLRVLGAIAVGGFLGGTARYELGLAFPTPHGAFPAATFGINVAGSFILALLTVFVLEILPPTVYLRPLLGVGFCGALTTFSTWMLDTDRLLGAGHYGSAAADLFGSLAAGLAATSLGLTVGRAVVAHLERRLRGEPPQERELVAPQAGSR